MPRLFGSKKDSKGRQLTVVVRAPKKRFQLFRRGGHGPPGSSTLESCGKTTSLASSDPTNQSYRVSVYETRANSPTPTCGSSDGSGDEDHLETGPAVGATGTGRPSPSPHRFQAQVDPASWRNKLLLTQYQLSNIQTTPPSFTGLVETDMPPPRSNSPVSSLELDLMRNATSLTDEMSTVSSEDQDGVPKENVGENTRSAPTTGIKAVSFSKDVRDPPPKQAGSFSTCLPSTSSGRSKRRSLRRRRQGDFSLTQEVGELCYDVTYFFRCFAEENKDPTKSISDSPTIPDDEQTNDSSSMLDRSSSLASGSVQQSRGSI